MSNSNHPDSGPQERGTVKYRVIQFAWDNKHKSHNEIVSDFESLVTHHPESNKNAKVINGLVVDAENGRAHALIGGEIQEIEISRNGRTYGLRADQILIKKDLILENSDLPSGAAGVRNVDVPSPVAGYVGQVVESEGRVDVYDREGGMGACAGIRGRVGGKRDQPADAQLALGGVEHAQLAVPPDDLERFTGELRRRHDPPE